MLLISPATVPEKKAFTRDAKELNLNDPKKLIALYLRMQHYAQLPNLYFAFTILE
jgi:hypothetical protein